MNGFTKFSLTAITMLCLAVALPAVDAVAQQKQKVSYKTPSENTKYPQQHLLDVGDVPGHQVRIYEIHRTYPSNAPVFNGIKLKEQWTRGISDYTDNSGPNTNYSIYVLENGDKFFTQASVLAHGVGGGKLTTMTTGHITGGTGKLAGIRGTIRATGSADPKAGINENNTEIEYWIEK